MQGKISVIHRTGQGVFAGLPEQLTVNRNHSLAIERSSCPDVLAVTAWTDDGEIMGGPGVCCVKSEVGSAYRHMKSCNKSAEKPKMTDFDVLML